MKQVGYSQYPPTTPQVILDAYKITPPSEVQPGMAVGVFIAYPTVCRYTVSMLVPSF